MDSDHWNFQVWTIGKKRTLSGNSHVALNISHDKQKGSHDVLFNRCLRVRLLNGILVCAQLNW